MGTWHPDGSAVNRDRLNLAPAFLLRGTRATLAAPRPLAERTYVVYVRRGPGNEQRGMHNDGILQAALRDATKVCIARCGWYRRER